MTTATKPAKTGQHAERARELHDSLTDAVNELTASDGWRRYLDTLAAFHTYSPHNVLLIMRQRPDAPQVAGYKQWQKLGRQVRRGERGIRIFGYGTRKVSETDPETGEEMTRTVPYFPVVSVFDVEQTAGDPLPEIDGPLADISEPDAETLTERLTAWIVGQGWMVQRGRTEPAGKGWTDHDSATVRLGDDLDTVDTARVLVHEAAHVVLHGPDSPFVTDREYQLTSAHRGVAEVQADSAAYVLAGLAGLDLAPSSVGYVAGWATAAAETRTDSEALTDVVRRAGEAVHYAVGTLAEVVAPSAT